MMKFLAFLVVFYGFLVAAQEKSESSISERFNLVESLKDVLNNHKLIKATKIDI